MSEADTGWPNDKMAHVHGSRETRTCFRLRRSAPRPSRGVFGLSLRSGQRHPAIDGEIDARHEFALRGAEEKSGLRKFFGLAHPAERDRVRSLLLDL